MWLYNSVVTVIVNSREECIQISYIGVLAIIKNYDSLLMNEFFYFIYHPNSSDCIRCFQRSNSHFKFKSFQRKWDLLQLKTYVISYHLEKITEIIKLYQVHWFPTFNIWSYAMNFILNKSIFSLKFQILDSIVWNFQ